MKNNDKFLIFYPKFTKFFRILITYMYEICESKVRGFLIFFTKFEIYAFEIAVNLQL